LTARDICVCVCLFVVLFFVVLMNVFRLLRRRKE
jgi:hypothetical protein